MADRLSRRKRLAFIVLAMGSAAVLAGACGEVAVRLFANTYSVQDIESRSLTYRPSVFTRHRLNQDRVVNKINGPADNAILINSRGFRGAEFHPQKDSGVIRILFLGGSSVFCANDRGVGNDWPHQIGTLLNNGDLKVEVINASVPGHDTVDSVGKFLTELWMYEPDYVVLYQGYNDQKYFDLVDQNLAYRDIHFPFDPEQDPRMHVAGLDRLLCGSKLYLELRYRFLELIYQEEGEPIPLAREHLQNRLSSVALAQYRLNLQMICDLAYNVGAVPILCKQARLVHPDNTAQDVERLNFRYVNFTHEAWCSAFAAADQILEEVGRQKNALVVDVSDSVTGRSEYFHDHIHLTNAGDAVVAELVGSALEQKILADETMVAKASTAATNQP